MTNPLKSQGAGACFEYCLKAVAALCVFGSAQTASSASVSGQVRIGSYTRSVEFNEPLNGETSNDESVLSAQVKADVQELNSSEDRIQMDFRDKIDSYGKLDAQNLSLGTYNRFQIRELAYKRPYEYNALYFSFGRFSLPEAMILDNDGAEVGYRWNRNSRIGLFGGQAPKDVVTPVYIDPNTDSVNNTQGGLYYSYEKKIGVVRQVLTHNAVAMAPTYNITDKDSHTYFYHMGLWNLSPSQRVSSYLQQDFSPTSSLRRASLNYDFLGPKLNAGVGLAQTNTEDYLIKQDLLDPLPPSGEQALTADLRYRVFSALSLDLSGGYTKRTEDGKAETETAVGLIFPGVLLQSLSLRAQYGMRDSYISQDNYVRGGFDYWNQYFSFSVIHTISQEKYDDGFENSRQTTMIDGGFYIGESIRGSLGYQLESDDRLKASAFFAMVGYRFGSAVPPIRKKPALFEEI